MTIKIDDETMYKGTKVKQYLKQTKAECRKEELKFLLSLNPISLISCNFEVGNRIKELQKADEMFNSQQNRKLSDEKGVSFNSKPADTFKEEEN